LEGCAEGKVVGRVDVEGNADGKELGEEDGNELGL
jgi:hypothetical protein